MRLAVAALLFSSAASAISNPFPGGNITTNTTLTKAGSPWVIQGDATVQPQATLTIEAGAVVQFAITDNLGSGTDSGRTELIIQGKLVANGTAQDHISLGATGGNWYGLRVEPGALASSLAFVDLTNSLVAITQRSANPLDLADVAVTSASTGLRVSNQNAGAMSVTWTRGRMVNVGAAFELTPGPGVALTVSGGHFDGLTSFCTAPAGATLQILGNVITGVGKALTLQPGAALEFINNLVALDDDGLTLSQTTGSAIHVINNTFDGYGVGVALNVPAVADAGSFVIMNNIVTHHATGVAVAAGTSPSMTYNDLFGNGVAYNGGTPGVGSISANPLYTSPPSIPATPSTVDSPHNYVNNYDNSWTVTAAGAGRMRVHFTQIATEACCDAVELYDGNNVLQASYKGTLAAFWGPWLNGGTQRLRLHSDSSNVAYGFSVDVVQASAASPAARLQQSSPCIDTGNGIGAPATDLDGAARPFDGNQDHTASWDIGAYEWHDNLPPVAVPGAEQTVHPNTAVHFDGSASQDPDGTIASWAWDFKDSATATGATATHTFAAAGDYAVQLTVTDNLGATASATVAIHVRTNLPPQAKPGADRSTLVGQTVSFDGSASSDPDGTISAFSWSFGDSSPAATGATVTHSWAAVGTYTVTLTVTDNLGATGSATTNVTVNTTTNTPPVAHAGGPYSAVAGTSITFDGSTSSDADGTIASYAWDFGDSGAGVGARPAHTFAATGTFLVRLTVTDDKGATATDSALATVTAAGVKPHITSLPSTAASLGAAYKYDADGKASADGTTPISWTATTRPEGFAVDAATGLVTWQPGAAGSFDACLRATNAYGSDDQCWTVTVGVKANQPPVAKAVFSGAEGLTASFDGSGSTDPDGQINGHTWDFGDGHSDTGTTVTHTYEKAGTYAVHLTVTDDAGASASDVTIATVGGAAGKSGCSAAGADLLALLGLAAAFGRRRRAVRS